MVNNYNISMMLPLTMNLLCLCCMLAYSVYARLIIIKPVETLDLKAYSGRWFQMHSSSMPRTTFENDLVCITADYNIVPTDPFSLTNIVGSNFDVPTNERIERDMGFLLQNLAKPSGKLAIEIDGKIERFMHYLVIALGPVRNEKYEWAVVSDISGLFLFILARDPVDFYECYEREVLDWVEDNGFDKAFNKPIPSYQGPDCAYNPPETESEVETNLRSYY